MRILHMTLHRRWFDEIAAGRKKEEYREIKEYWTKRLTNDYDIIQFRNGYAKDSPVLTIEYLGCEVKKIIHPMTGNLETVYALKLGKVLNIINYNNTVTKRLPDGEKGNSKRWRKNTLF